MCGIFWYLGTKDAAPILLHGLQRLEYRGYDSAGLAVMNDVGQSKIIKAVGKVSNLASTVAWSDLGTESYHLGIAHTRWATHGGVTIENTHPHTDADQQFIVVHNGIIENQHKIKHTLQNEWYVFYSQTDTEVVPALLAKHRDGNFLNTVETVLPLLTWSSGFLIWCKDAPDELIAFKRWSPIILGINRSTGEYFLSSDAQALSGYALEIIHLQDGELLHLHGGDFTIRAESKVINKATELLQLDAMEIDKWSYAHFMLKEIHEQAAIIERICRGRVDFTHYQLVADAFHGMQDEQYRHIVLVACGTSYHAAMVGAYRLEQIAGIPARAEIASEYIHRHIPTTPDTLHIFLSQSGETADSIAVLKYIASKGWKTFGIVNVVGSTIAHLTDSGLFMRAGFEIGVASTKAFTAQLTCLLLLTLFLWRRRSLSETVLRNLLDQLHDIPSKISTIIGQSDDIDQIAQELSCYSDMFYLWRAWQYPIACEWSLKMKEISYIHSEAYPAGELKHGPLALIQDDVPSMVICIDDEFYHHNISSIAEVQARKGPILAISNKPLDQAERTICIPHTHSYLAPFLTTIVLQLLSYYTALHLGRDIDKPRNLAKSVTVK
jgi:glucosamine--fructose-6-phosphate aminotransferase (isomerizing)